MDIMKRYKHGELSADVAKVKNEKLAIDPNSKVTQGATAGDSEAPSVPCMHSSILAPSTSTLRHC